MSYKLKDLPNLKNIPEKLEVEVEGIEDGKVLLVNSGGKIHALSARCTHYGAPLKNGVVDGERLTCPWHGACFNIKSGDIEDAPALNALNKYDLIEKDDGVYVNATESDIKASQRNPVQKCTISSQEEVLVVGGGSGTIGLVQSLREQSYPGKITVLSKEPSSTDKPLPIDRPKLSKALIPDPSKIHLHPEPWYKDAGIQIHPEEVTSINVPGKTVHTSSGKKYTFTKLVLATGGVPRNLPLPGFNLKNIFTLRNTADVQTILSSIPESTENEKPNIVVVGSSFIGMEVSTALSSKGNVTVLGMESSPMERIMGTKVGKIFQSNLEKMGIKFKLNASVEKAVDEHSTGKVSSIHCKDGTILPADLVVLGVGVRPATEYLQGNENFILESDGSLATDIEFHVVKGDAGNDVFAIGDIATFPYTGPGGNSTPTRIEHWNVAQNSGRSVARSIVRSSGASGNNVKKPGADTFIPIFWSALGGQLRYVGNTVNGFDDVHITGQPDEGKFVAYYCNGDVVVAVATMGMDPVMAKVATLMRGGKMVGKKEVLDGVDVLSL
ncbi:uncharacterized protein N7469_005156 [Penicillium citrinum]|uniref:Rieske domain-containing protein n=2 Tax=Penicillium TaxID=5073 RepID=A0A9W9P156_PENCI|nr:uncharacterized protein N7469_005156 [Penicillium citrinum]KAJ5233390.1 hypothetical protein N7469_005156 [Penicillium citrinum]KAJ5573141.1 hypothetical protein N7450_010125 [Penicillium hetheringtonii]